LTIEYKADKNSRNVGKKNYQSTLHKIPEQRRRQEHKTCFSTAKDYQNICSLLE